MPSGRSSWPMMIVSCCAASAFRIPTRFDPRGALSDDDLAAEHISGMWQHGDIAQYDGTDLFSPRDLAPALAALIAGDIPARPVMLGL